MNDDKTNRDLYRGESAQALINNPTLQEAFADIEKEIFNVWQNSKTNQTQIREEAWMTQRAMELLKLKLHNWVNNGKIAKAELEIAQAKKKQAAKNSNRK